MTPRSAKPSPLTSPTACVSQTLRPCCEGMMMVSRIAPRFPSCRVSTRSSANAVPRAAATRRRGFRQRHAFLSSISASLGPLGLSTAVYELKEPPNAELGQPLCLIRHGVDLREFLGEEIEDA